MKLIAGSAPITYECLFRFFMRVPITERGRVAFDLERAHLAGWDFSCLSINNFCVIPGNDAAQAAGLHITRPVRDVDMKHLSRSDPITNLDPERFFPAMIKFDRQCFTG